MSRAAAVLLTRGRTVAPAPPPSGDAFAVWSATTIAGLWGAPIENVRSQWPLVWHFLDMFGFSDRPVLIAAIANIGLETASFLPVREAWWLSEEWRRQNLWYWPYYGRGLLQMSLESNYREFGPKLSALLGRTIDLIADPDLALEQDVSAAFFGLYFRDHRYGSGYGIPEAARAGDWTATRLLVNGGLARYDEYLGYVQALQDA
jgi:hypothetical protein